MIMKKSGIEKVIDLLSGWFLNGVILAVWGASVFLLTRLDYPAAFQIWPVLLVLAMIAFSLPFALAIMLKGGFTHSARKTVF